MAVKSRLSKRMLNRSSGMNDQRAFCRFLDELFPNKLDQREELRWPVSKLATLYVDNFPCPLIVTIRDVSMSGIGLAHDVPLELGEATIRITMESDAVYCARINLVWCKQTVRDYYWSGGTFVRLDVQDPLSDRGI